MSRRAAVRIDHLADLPADLPGVWWRVERRWWADGSSCLHIAKWALQPSTGRPAPWWPPQYVQVPWQDARAFLQAVLEAVSKSEQVQVGAVDW
ncbi:MAG: hypothetical protein DIU70_006390 [Bacillota bacterium]|nr:MAG: hypothetical protein DIU70_14055 [Bacillota bacterium]